MLLKYIEDRLKNKDEIDTRRIIIAHTFTDENLGLVDMAKAHIESILPFQDVLVATAGGTISCHCGPNTFGVFLIRR